MLNPKTLPPVLLPQRIALDKIWGGRALAAELGLKQPRIGETWDCFDRGAESSAQIENAGGATLHELCKLDAEAVLGAAKLDRFGRFPLMLKLLDATQRLSLQVHPADPQARGLGMSDPGKTEAWVVLRAAPASELICGFRGTVDDLCRSLAGGDVDEVKLVTRTASVGEVVAIPPGTVHAVGAGYVLYEIQQNSDITLRLYDWGRLGDDGQPRDLHLDAGKAAIESASRAEAPASEILIEEEGVESLVRNDCFVLRRLEIDTAVRVETGGVCALVTPIEGAATIEDVDVDLLRIGIVRGALSSVTVRPRDSKAALLVASPVGGGPVRVQRS